MKTREEEKRLIELSLMEKPTQENLDAFLSVWDIESESAEKSLCLAVFKKKHPELSFPQYVGPRLDGIIRFFRFKYTSLMFELKLFLAAMSEIDIPVLAMGDLAFCMLFKDTTHSIARLDVAVPKKYLPDARQKATKHMFVEGRDNFYFEGCDRYSNEIPILVPGKDILFYEGLKKMNGCQIPLVDMPTIIIDLHSLACCKMDDKSRQLSRNFLISYLLKHPRRIISWLKIRIWFIIYKNIRTGFVMKIVLAKYKRTANQIYVKTTR